MSSVYTSNWFILKTVFHCLPFFSRKMIAYNHLTTVYQRYIIKTNSSPLTLIINNYWKKIYSAFPALSNLTQPLFHTGSHRSNEAVMANSTETPPTNTSHFQKMHEHVLKHSATFQRQNIHIKLSLLRSFNSEGDPKQPLFFRAMEKTASHLTPRALLIHGTTADSPHLSGGKTGVKSVHIGPTMTLQ